MKRIFNSLKELQGFLALWGSQSLSSLGSSMTSFALIIWAYGQSGSALTTALLSVCSYTRTCFSAYLPGSRETG